MSDLDKILKKMIAEHRRQLAEYDTWWRREFKIVTVKCAVIILFGTAIAAIIVRYLP